MHDVCVFVCCYILFDCHLCKHYCAHHKLLLKILVVIFNIAQQMNLKFVDTTLHSVREIHKVKFIANFEYVSQVLTSICPYYQKDQRSFQSFIKIKWSLNTQQLSI